jgi:hypothetical protein
MEKYRLVQEHKGDGDDFLEPTTTCEVRITQQGKPRNYISYAMNLFVRDYQNTAPYELFQWGAWQIAFSS